VDADIADAHADEIARERYLPMAVDARSERSVVPMPGAFDSGCPAFCPQWRAGVGDGSSFLIIFAAAI
jgi:hypothetical protein